MKKIVKALLLTITAIVIVVLGAGLSVIGWGHFYRTTYNFDAPSSIVRADEGKTVIAKGKALYDENGDIYEIRGVNFGNLFIAAMVGIGISEA